MSRQTNSDSAQPSRPRGIAGLVVANSSLIVAVLVYMGWAYEDALYGYFHVRPLDLNVGIVEYMLRSLSLFSPAIVIIVVAVIAVIAVRAWHLNWTSIANGISAHMPAVGRLLRLIPARPEKLRSRGLLISAGFAGTVTALVLAWSSSHVHIATYLLLGFLACGPLLLTWPTRAERAGRLPYALAIIVAAVCGLWAASIYAQQRGVQAAINVVHRLPERTAVAVYSIQPLALSGPGVTVLHFSSQYHYRYRYEGLRLLITRAGTYYILPVGWTPKLRITYVLQNSDLTRIELYSGIQSTG